MKYTYDSEEWKSKALKIKSRDGLFCQMCGAYNVTLDVHHLYYLKGHKEEEYEDSALITLCRPCHVLAHDYKKWTEIILARVPLIYYEEFMLWLDDQIKNEVWKDL